MNATPSIEESWARFEAWLAAHAPVTHATLRAPAEPTEITQVERRIGAPVPPDLVSLLLRHDGTCVCKPGVGSYWEGGTAPCLFPGGHALLSADGIAHTYQLLNELHGPDSITEEDGEDADELLEDIEFLGWHPLWVPFAERNTGDDLFIDIRFGRRGAVGEFWRDDINRLGEWPSLAAMMAGIADAVEGRSDAGHYRPRVSDGVLEWEEGVPGRQLVALRP